MVADPHRLARVVVVDGDRDTRELVRRCLETRVLVECCKSGEAALAALDREPADLVISDIGRQDKNDPDGLQFLQKLRHRPDETPVIFYVGDYEPQLGVPDGAFGITDRPDQLLHLVLDALA